MRSSRAAIAVATAAYVLGMAAQTTFVFYLVPTYAVAHGVPDAQMLAYAVQALAATAVGLPAGRLAADVPRRRVMRLGWALMAAGSFALALLPSPVNALLVGSALVGAGLSYGFVGFQSYIADLFRGGGIARAYGSTGAIAVLGGAAAPFVAGRVIVGYGDAAAAVFVALLALAGLVLTFPLRAVARLEQLPHPGVRVGFAAATLFSFDPRGAWRQASGGSLPYLVAFAILGLGFGLTVPWMGPFLLESHGLSAGAFGTLVALATAAGAAGIFLAGLAGERVRSAMRLALATNLALAVTLVAFAFAPTLGLASIAFLARHFVGNPTGGILSSGLAQESSAEERSVALGATNIAWNLPWAIGAIAGGALRDVLEGWLFVAGAIIVALGPIAGLALARQRERRGATRPSGRPRAT